MNINSRVSSAAIAAAALTILVGLTGFSDSDDTPISYSQVRVIHASPDAPPVNIKLNGTTAITGLDYAESIGYLQITAGFKDVAVEAIIPGGNSDVVTLPGFDSTANAQFTIMAVDTTANIEPFVVSDAAVAPGDYDIRVVLNGAFSISV